MDAKDKRIQELEASLRMMLDPKNHVWGSTQCRWLAEDALRGKYRHGLEAYMKPPGADLKTP